MPNGKTNGKIKFLWWLVTALTVIVFSGTGLYLKNNYAQDARRATENLKQHKATTKCVNDLEKQVVKHQENIEDIKEDVRDVKEDVKAIQKDTQEILRRLPR